MFDLKNLVERARADLAEYARSRQRDVARGAETRELAGLLVQKYGYGLAQGVRLVADLADEPDPGLLADVDREVATIDPDWRENQQRRFGATPAGLDVRS